MSVEKGEARIAPRGKEPQRFRSAQSFVQGKFRLYFWKEQLKLYYYRQNPVFRAKVSYL